MRTKAQPTPLEGSSPVNPRRRNLLLAFGVGGAGAAAVAAGSLSGVSAVVQPEKESTGSYRLTDHIERYYRTAKL